jgi:predicted P-loop ATPase
LNATDRATLKARLLGHFGKRVSKKDLDAAIKEERAKVRVMAKQEEEHWAFRLLTNMNGSYQGNLANAITALRYAPEWEGVLAWDEFAVCTMARKKPPIAEIAGKWENHHDVLTCDWLQHQGIEVSVPIAGLAVEAVARLCRYNPPKDFLTALKWDGVSRLDNMLIRYLGATTEQPSLAGEGPRVRGYLETVGRKWMIGAVARIMQPGCKVDCALIFEGEQGKGKSSALRILGGEWFTDQLETMGSKDSSMQTHGVWIIEIAELQSMSKGDTEQVKAFISRQVERYRPPYAGRLVEIPRQCVFAGSVNTYDWNKDETGARRFWPVRCERVDLEALKADREQLWAEARDRYDHNESWWLDDPEVIRAAEQEQADRLQEDPWGQLMRNYLRFELADRDATVPLILTECLKIPVDRMSQSDQNRVARIFRAEGWRKQRLNRGGFRTPVYRPYTSAARLAYAVQADLVEA